MLGLELDIHTSDTLYHFTASPDLAASLGGLVISAVAVEADRSVVAAEQRATSTKRISCCTSVSGGVRPI